MDLTELECGGEELKLEREEMAKMAQTFKESTFKDLLAACMGEIIATMQNMAMIQDKVNEKLIKIIVGIVRSPSKKLH
jgi:uncharacterized protein (UPF0216 family)